ncbi:Desulfoferrodoxin [Desulfovibrionales bacterium]
MTRQLEIYKCELCGNVIEILHAGSGELVCCGQPMIFLKENTIDAAKEKHIPVFKKVVEGYTVSVGATLHIMETKHYIEWIEFIADGKTCRQSLKPGDTPVATFFIQASKIMARAYCNIHGVWKAEL